MFRTCCLFVNLCFKTKFSGVIYGLPDSDVVKLILCINSVYFSLLSSALLFQSSVRSSGGKLRLRVFERENIANEIGVFRINEYIGDGESTTATCYLQF